MNGSGTSRAFGPRDVLNVALPMILANVSVPLVGLADSAAVGHLDQPYSLAGVAVGATVFSVLFTALNFLRMGTTGLAAQAFGAGDDQAGRRALVQGLVVALVLALLLIACARPLEALALHLISPEPAVAEQAAAYFRIRIWCAPSTLALFVMTGWFIGRGDGRSPLAIVLTVNVVNIVLDFALVQGAGMTADGVALATLSAEYLGLAVGWRLAVRAAPGRWWRHARHGGYRAYLALNLPLLVRTTALMFAFAFLTAMGARFGSAVLAANALLLNFLYFASYALDGFANAAESLVGRAVGARNDLLLRQAIRVSAQWTAAVAVGLALLFALFGWLTIGLLTSQPILQGLAREYFPWLIAAPLVGCWAYLFDGVFVGATMNREMRDTMLFAVLAGYLPAWWLLRPFDNHGLWASFLVFLAARGLAQWWVLSRRLRRDMFSAA